jgi:hypothetical protein
VAVNATSPIVIGLVVLSAACTSERPVTYDDPPAGSYATASVLLQLDDVPTPVRAASVSPAFFAAAKVPPLFGRLFIPVDYESRVRVAVISHELWTRQFGASPRVIGQEISLNGNSATIVGVTPSGFQFPGGTMLWTPRSAD